MNATLSKPKPKSLFPRVGQFTESGEVVGIETRVLTENSFSVRQGKAKAGDTYRVFLVVGFHSTSPSQVPEASMKGARVISKRAFEEMKAKALNNAAKFYKANPHLA